MALYLLHLYNSLGFVPDEEGKELSDLAAARRVAADAIRDILGEEVKKGVIDLRGRIEIANEAQEALAVVPFLEAVEIRLPEEMP